MAGASFEQILASNAKSAFNGLCGFEPIEAAAGVAQLGVTWKESLGQSSGFLHAGVIAALVDTACGYAAASMVGPVMSSHYSVSCLRPGIGERFVARARVTKAGRTQIFVFCELFAIRAGEEVLIATGETILVPYTPSGAAPAGSIR